MLLSPSKSLKKLWIISPTLRFNDETFTNPMPISVVSNENYFTGSPTEL